MNRVFVSYSRRNKNFAERLARDLSDAGLDVWVDFRQIHGGELWRKEIDKGIARSEMLVVVLSPDAIKSTWVPYEVNSARDQGKFIIPVMAVNALKDLEGAENMAWLLDVHFINFMDRYEEAFPELLNALPGKRRLNPFDEVDPATIANPFKGLEAFQQTDAHFFFGRENLIRKSLQRLGTETSARFLAVVGASGSGKSSLVRAGLIPEIRGGALSGSDHWPVFIFTPGSTPVQSLAQRLSPLLETMDTDAVRTELYQGEDRLAGLVARVIGKDPEAHRLLMIVDQFEEVFTRAGEVERQAFLKMLYHAVTIEGGHAQVMITMRADFFDQLGRYPPIAELFEQENMVIVTEMSAADLVRTIEGPATAVGLVYEEGLPQRILDDVRRQPGSLPLLQYALKELFKEREGRQLTFAAYDRIGGVQQALAQHAENIYVEMNPAQQAIMRRLMLRLIEVSEKGEATRRRVDLNELSFRDVPDRQVHDLIELLTSPESRLLTTSREIRFEEDAQLAPTTWVEVAHEALIRQWDRFTGWVRENQESLRYGTELMQSALDWRQANGDVAYLLRGNRLTRAEIWLESADATQLQQEFIQASIEEDRRRQAAEAERTERELGLQRRAANRLRYFVGVLIIGLIVAGALTAFSIVQTNLAEAAREEADRQAEVALSLARSASAVEALIDNDNDTAILLALAANAGIDDPPLESQRNLATIAFGAGTRSIFNGHSAPDQAAVDRVLDVAYGPDGALAASIEDNMLIVWEVLSSAVLWQVEAADGASFNAVVFDPLGRYVITGDDAFNVVIWDADSGELVRTLTGHTRSVKSVDVNFNGTRIISGGEDRAVNVWDVGTGSLLLSLTGHSAPVNSVDFSADSRRIVSGGEDASVIVWATDDGAEVARFFLDDVVSSVAFDPSGTFILAGLGALDNDGDPVGTGAIVLASLESGAVDFLVQRRFGVYGVAFSPEFDREPRDNPFESSGTNQLIVFGLGDGLLVVYDVLTGRVINTFDVHDAAVVDVAFSDDGNRLLSASYDGTVRVWDIVRAAQAQRFLGHSTRAREQIVTGVMTANGYRVLSGSYDDTLRLWDATTGLMVQEFTGHTDDVNDVAITADGLTALSASSDGTVIVWDVVTGEPTLRFDAHDAEVRTVVLFDEQQALSGDANGRILLWDIETGTVNASYDPGDKAGGGHTDTVFALAVSQDRTRFASASADESVIVWDVATGTAGVPFTGHKSSVRALAFSPDGTTIASGAANGSLILWNAESGFIVRRIDEHEGAVQGIEFTADGSQVLSGGRDNTIRLWDVESGQELRNHTTTAPVNSIDLSANGEVALAGLESGELNLWLILVEPDELIDWTLLNRVVLLDDDEVVQGQDAFDLLGLLPEATAEATSAATALPPDFPRLVVNGQAMVNTDRGDTLNLRADASINAQILEQMPDGTRVTLLEGPVAGVSFVWWRIRIEDGEFAGQEGWAAETVPNDNLQSLVPVP